MRPHNNSNDLFEFLKDNFTFGISVAELGHTTPGARRFLFALLQSVISIMLMYKFQSYFLRIEIARIIKHSTRTAEAQGYAQEATAEEKDLAEITEMNSD